MPRQYWSATQPPIHTADGASYNTSITLTDVSLAPQRQFAAMQLEPGTIVECWARGHFSNTGTPTLLLGFYWGGVAGVALAASTAITTTTGATLWPWKLHYRGTVRAVGTSGQIQGDGELYLGTSLTALTIREIPETAALRTVTIDTTIVKTLSVGAQWGASSASNALFCTDHHILIHS